MYFPGGGAPWNPRICISRESLAFNGVRRGDAPWGNTSNNACGPKRCKNPSKQFNTTQPTQPDLLLLPLVPQEAPAIRGPCASNTSPTCALSQETAVRRQNSSSAGASRTYAVLPAVPCVTGFARAWDPPLGPASGVGPEMLWRAISCSARCCDSLRVKRGAVRVHGIFGPSSHSQGPCALCVRGVRRHADAQRAAAPSSLVQLERAMEKLWRYAAAPCSGEKPRTPEPVTHTEPLEARKQVNQSGAWCRKPLHQCRYCCGQHCEKEECKKKKTLKQRIWLTTQRMPSFTSMSASWQRKKRPA